MLALIRSTTDNIIARYVMSYTYSDRFEKELARVKKMAEILPDKGEKYLREMNNKKHITPGAPLPETILKCTGRKMSIVGPERELANPYKKYWRI